MRRSAATPAHAGFIAGGARSRRPAPLLLTVLAAAAHAAAGTPDPGTDLVAHEPGLEIRLVAREPRITGPVGITIGPDDRLYVLESRTHQPAGVAAGPLPDRILVFADADAGGTSGSRTVFAEGFTRGMSLAFTPDGDLLVACAREVWRLRDTDADGVADHRERLLLLVTDNPQPHTSLTGLAVAPDGWIHVGRGHNSGMAWRLEGADGSSVDGYGDGGAIHRARTDGTGVETVATGFWNPFGLAFDATGRMVATDNDPDARGPNRLLHVVPGGDYGARALHGDAGTHPFQGWDGDRPGTLPIAAGLGEAPAGVIDSRRTTLSRPGEDSLLVAVWGEHRLDRLILRPRGTSFTATAAPLVSGSADFSPVALAADSHGTVYLTDWAQGDYASRGAGRIWSVRQTGPRQDPGVGRGRDRSARRSARRLEQLATAGPGRAGVLRRALGSSDPFVVHAARRSLADARLAPVRNRLRGDPDPRLRTQALLATIASGNGSTDDALRSGLTDPDPEVRRTALILAGETLDPRLRPALDSALAAGPADPRPDPRLFATYLAAVEMLQPGFPTAVRERSERRSARIPRPPETGLLERFAEDRTQPGEVRAMALSRLVAVQPADHRPRLIQALGDPEPAVALAAARALGGTTAPDSDAALRRRALDPVAATALRIEALLGLGGRHDPGVVALLPLLRDSDPEVRREAARLLRAHSGHPEHPEVRAAFLELADAGTDPATDDIVAAALGRSVAPESPEAWERLAGAGGDPNRGGRVFFSAQTGCAHCHAVGGRGGDAGPELSHIAASLGRDRIVRSILYPSEQFAPRYQTWYVEIVDGPTHLGLHPERETDGAVTLWIPGVGRRRFAAGEVAGCGPLPSSLMPDGLEQTMTPEEFRDLAAYLSSLR